MSKTNSNRKGKRGEREAAHFLQRWFPSARRTQQYNGDGLSDVVCDELPNLHIEVKYGYPLTDFHEGSANWWKAVSQANRDADGKPWVILWRTSRSRWWRVTYLGVPGLCTVSENYTDETCPRIYDVLTWLHNN